MNQPILYDGLRFEQTNICRGQSVYVDSTQQTIGKLIGYNEQRNVWLVQLEPRRNSQLYLICNQFYPVNAAPEDRNSAAAAP